MPQRLSAIRTSIMSRLMANCTLALSSGVEKCSSKDLCKRIIDSPDYPQFLSEVLEGNRLWVGSLTCFPFELSCLKSGIPSCVVLSKPITLTSSHLNIETIMYALGCLKETASMVCGREIVKPEGYLVSNIQVKINSMDIEGVAFWSLHGATDMLVQLHTLELVISLAKISINEHHVILKSGSVPFVNVYHGCWLRMSDLVSYMRDKLMTDNPIMQKVHLEYQKLLQTLVAEI